MILIESLLGAWAVIVTVKWYQERKRNRRLHAEYRRMRDSAIALYNANKDLEERCSSEEVPDE